MFNSRTFRRLAGFQAFLRQHGGIPKCRESSSKQTGRRAKDGNYDVLTLDPKKFAEKKQQPLCIANSFTCYIHVVLPKQSTSGITTCLFYDKMWQTGKTVPVPFPGTDAFLYYAASNPRISGQLRLRVASSNDPDSFASGSDLMRDGQPWSKSLCTLSKSYPLLYEKLKEEGLVPEDLASVISTLSIPRFCESQMLYSLDDPFILNFSRAKLWVVTEKGVERIRFPDLFQDGREGGRRAPYTGRVLARFERSTIQDHKGTRTIVLRILKIVTPVKCVVPDYDGYIMWPMEGQLFRRYFRKLTPITSDPPIWSSNIDKQKRGGTVLGRLQLLWDV